MRVFAMGDIHGCKRELMSRVEQIEALGFMGDGCEDELVLLGDYIDRGPDSLGVLDLLMGLCSRYPDRVHPLAGNHEDELLAWLGASGHIGSAGELWFDADLMWNETAEMRYDELVDQRMDLEARMLAWRMTDRGAMTMRSLLGPSNWRAFGPPLRRRSTMVEAFAEACECIRDERSRQLAWVSSLDTVRETERQVFVHAGVDESLGDEWRLGTPRDMLLNDRTCRRGRFAKDIIAGHTPTMKICGDPAFHGVLWDGASHFYVDGATPSSGVLPVLVWDSCDGSYTQLNANGETIDPRIWQP